MGGCGLGVVTGAAVVGTVVGGGVGMVVVKGAVMVTEGTHGVVVTTGCGHRRISSNSSTRSATPPPMKKEKLLFFGASGWNSPLPAPTYLYLGRRVGSRAGEEARRATRSAKAADQTLRPVTGRAADSPRDVGVPSGHPADALKPLVLAQQNPARPLGPKGINVRIGDPLGARPVS